ncbi:MAG TPA: orotidine-5'-phosphate decarboxylase [Clostridiaceae bacterium]|nr:orotidine-5'-phosphate decarboxylase [Clostridiaceae bacterium]
MFIDRLIDNILEKNNPSVIGLDPRIEYVPSSIREKSYKEFGRNSKGAAEAIWVFNKRIIDAVYDIVPAVKLQMACYEIFGIEGMEVLSRTIKYAREKGLMVIADGKRNDIGSTAQAYSTAFLGSIDLGEGPIDKAFDVDALTVNPYLGYDGIKPFIDDCRDNDKGIFVLVKTSNKSSGQLQDLLMQDGRSVYEVVACYVEKWGNSLIGKYGYSSVGAVVGATYPNQAKVLRGILKSTYILVPGYGAQGGTARDAAHSFDKNGMGAIVNASRSVICAYQSDIWKNEYNEDRFDEASRAEALRMRDELNEALQSKKTS